MNAGNKKRNNEIKNIPMGDEINIRLKIKSDRSFNFNLLILFAFNSAKYN
jgi:phage/plasmid-associated DNA primase